MTWRFARRRDLHVGIALHPDRLTAILPGADSGVWVRELARSESGMPAASELAHALRLLRDAVLEVAGARDHDVARWWLDVALLPPLAQLRRLDLPGMTPGDARRAVQREPSRFMPLAAATPMEVELDGSGWRGVTPFQLLAIPRALADAVQAAAGETGWRVGRMLGAHSAWAAALPAMARVRTADATMIVCLGDRLDVLDVVRGAIRSARRFPPTGIGARAAVNAHRDSGQALVVVIGDAAAAGEIRSLLRAPATGVIEVADTPSAIAARHVAQARGPCLLPEAEREARRRTAVRATIARLAAAGLVLAASAGMLLWGAVREEAHIAARRAALRAPVTRAIATRDSLSSVLDALATLRARAGTPMRWSSVLASLSVELPDDAVLAGMTADHETLRLEGSAQRAAAVFDAVARVHGVQAVHADEPIRQNIATGGVRSERFALSASLRAQP